MQMPAHPKLARRRCRRLSLVVGLLLGGQLMAQNAIPESPVGMAAAQSALASRGLDEIFRSTFDEQWVDVSGPAFWQCNANCSVVAGQFVEDGPGMTINSTGSWALGFRPTAVRVDATISPMKQLGVGLGAGGVDFASCENYVVNTPCLLNVYGNIERMNLYNAGTVRRIEFLVP